MPSPIDETTVAAPGTLAGRPQFKVPGQPATNGARTWGVQNIEWSDDEVRLRHRFVCLPTSGYLSTEDTGQDAVDEPRRSADQAQTNDEPVRQSFVQDFNLKSPRDFTVPSVDCRKQQSKALNGDPTFTVTQSQLMKIVRRACHDVTSTSPQSCSTSSSPPVGQRPPNPSDDSGDDKDGKKPERRGSERSRLLSPPPNRSESTACPQPWKK